MGPLVPDGVAEGPQEAVEWAILAASRGPLLISEETTLNEINSLVINGVGTLLSKLAKQVNNKTLDFIAIQKGEQHRANKSDHYANTREGVLGVTSNASHPSGSSPT